MNDLHARFRTFDALDAPSLWTEIEVRAVAARRPMQGSLTVVLAAAVLLVVAIIGGVMSMGSGLTGGPHPSSTASPRPVTADRAPGAWTGTGSMAQARHGQTATLLGDGRVLVAGGFDGTTALASAEIFDPRTGSWTATGPLAEARGLPSAALLADGKVLVFGGDSKLGEISGGRAVTADVVLASAELYDPQTGTWSSVAPMTVARSGASSIVLADGRVLVAGGWGAGDTFGPKLSSAEVYDPTTRAWSATGSMSTNRHGFGAVLLPNGAVLIAGGYNDSGRLATCEVYDPATGTWTATGRLPEPFLPDTAVLLPDGTVLLSGGDVPSGPGALGSNHAALYDVATGTWRLARPMIQPRLAAPGVLMPDGRVLVSGGRINGGPDSPTFATAELYDPATGTWTATADMSVSRSGHEAIVLVDGRVLVVGGATGSSGETLASAELFKPVARS